MPDYRNKDLVFNEIPSGKLGWSSPSNIAIIKYWGKKGFQLPMNPSLSFTLSKSITETVIEFSPSTGDSNKLDFYFDGIPNNEFAKKTSSFFSRLMEFFPFLDQFDFKVFSKNTFPHSTGIASSASGMSALALAICDIENTYFNTFNSTDDFYRKASFAARLGSGSACRSVYGKAVLWGRIPEYAYSSDDYATPLDFDINPVFNDYQDTILIVDPNKKKVSSTLGHELMNSNPFAGIRIQQSEKNMISLISALKTGDLNEFVKVMENEALTLHALMMTSDPSFILMKPNTLKIIDRIWEFRKDTGIPVGFTLDAGPNIHVLYPLQHKSAIKDFIESIKKYTTGTVINDKVGNGPEKLLI